MPTRVRKTGCLSLSLKVASSSTVNVAYVCLNVFGGPLIKRRVKDQVHRRSETTDIHLAYSVVSVIYLIMDCFIKQISVTLYDIRFVILSRF